MVQLFSLALLLFSFTANADLFDFGSSEQSYGSKLPVLVEKLKTLEMKGNPAYEEAYTQAVKAIENGVEEEKLFCSGEAADSEGKTLPKDKKQLCMRELKKNYLEAMDVVFDLKKKYLALVHTKQIESLSGIQRKLKNDIEKSF